MDENILYSVFHFIRALLAIGGVIIVFLVVGSLFQRERARELVAGIRRAVKRN